MIGRLLRRVRDEYSIRAHLLAYGLAVAVPLLLLMAAFSMRAHHLERLQLEKRLSQTAENLADDVDREIDRRLAMLRTLAVLPALAADDLPAFHAQASAAAHAIGDDAGIFVIDPVSLQQLLNTYVPYGATLPTYGNPPVAARVIATKQPQVSGYFEGRVSRRPAFDVALPILRNGDVRYILTLGLRPEGLLPLLHGLKLGPEWISSVWDRDNIILARSRDNEKHAGKPLPTPWRFRDDGSVVTTDNLDGERVLLSTVASKLSGWRVSVNLPLAVIEAPLRSSLWLWGALAAAVVAFTTIGGFLFAYSVAQPIGQAAAAAIALGEGRPAGWTRSRLKEANQLGETLQAAQMQLAQREAALRASEQQLRDAAEAAQFGTHSFDVPRGHVRWSPQLKRILGSDIEGDVTPDMALRFIHPHDLGQTQTLMNDVLAGRRDRYEFEFRIIRPDQQVRWVMDRGEVVKNAGGQVVRVVGVLIDITDLKQGEERQQLLINELNHRIKNTLAIVQSIASQTLRMTPEPQEFEKAFSMRLAALAGAHGLLTTHAWEGATLEEIITTALAAFRGADPDRVRIAGPAVIVPANATITLSLMLHELATNAAKYGALSKVDGYVAVTWTTTDNPEATVVDLRWAEHDGPPVRGPERQGFGSRLVAVSAKQLGGELTIDYAPDGLRWQIIFPLRRLAEAAAAHVAREPLQPRLAESH